eukprot:g5047.t1
MTEAEQIPDAVLRVVNAIDLFRSEESARQGVTFKPRPNDILISTALKSGTTITQQICHGLRSGGDMSYIEIDNVTPILEMAYDYGIKDLYTPQLFQPQIYKTHMSRYDTPKGFGKYIIVVRKPADTALSFYHFLADWFFDKDEMSMEVFVKFIWLQMGIPKIPKELCGTIHHIMSWYPHRLDKNVLWLHYEDLNKHRRDCVRLIAEFLNIGVDDEELQELVMKQSSFEFMKQHPSKFDEHPLKHGRNEVAGLPRNAGLTGNPGKVRNGLMNAAKDTLPQSIIDKIDAQWNDIVTSATGYKTYEEFRNGINKELDRTFT